MKHTHPEIIHRDARRLLATEMLAEWRDSPYWGHSLPWKLMKSAMVKISRRFDLYLRTGAGKEF